MHVPHDSIWQGILKKVFDFGGELNKALHYKMYKPPA